MQRIISIITSVLVIERVKVNQKQVQLLQVESYPVEGSARLEVSRIEIKLSNREVKSQPVHRLKVRFQLSKVTR